LHHKRDFSVADRKHFEAAPNLTEPDDIAGFTVLALEIVGMNRAVKDGFSF